MPKPARVWGNSKFSCIETLLSQHLLINVVSNEVTWVIQHIVAVEIPSIVPSSVISIHQNPWGLTSRSFGQSGAPEGFVGPILILKEKVRVSPGLCTFIVSLNILVTTYRIINFWYVIKMICLPRDEWLKCEFQMVPVKFGSNEATLTAVTVYVYIN